MMPAVDPTRKALEAKKKELVEQIRVCQERISHIDTVLELFPEPSYNVQQAIQNGFGQEVVSQVPFGGLPGSQLPRQF